MKAFRHFITSLTLCIIATTSSAANKPSIFKVKAGDTVYSILRRHGFNDNQLKAALSQNPLPKTHVLSENAVYRAQANSNSNQFEVKFYAKDRHEAFVFWRDQDTRAKNMRDNNNAGSKVERVKFDIRTASASGRVRGSLVESLTQAIGDDLVAYRFMDAFLLDYPNLPKLLRKNAPFNITYEKLYENGQLVRYGEVLRAELEVNERNVVRDFRRLKTGGIFVNKSDDYSDRPFYSPVNYIRFSSLFQPRRFHPIQKFRRSHLGIDFELNEGEPIHAISSGRVLRVGRNRAAGNFVVLRHSNGYESYYNHLQKAVQLRLNEVVGVGELIGYVGCTGYCTKPHLHFAIKRGGTFVNPINLIRNYSYIQKHEITSFWSRAGL